MSDDTELSPQSDDETEAVLTEAAYAGPSTNFINVLTSGLLAESMRQQN